MTVHQQNSLETDASRLSESREKKENSVQAIGYEEPPYRREHRQNERELTLTSCYISGYQGEGPERLAYGYGCISGM